MICPLDTNSNFGYSYSLLTIMCTNVGFWTPLFRVNCFCWNLHIISNKRWWNLRNSRIMTRHYNPRFEIIRSKSFSTPLNYTCFIGIATIAVFLNVDIKFQIIQCVNSNFKDGSKFGDNFWFIKTGTHSI